MKIMYHFAYAILKGIAMLPFWALYALSDILFVIIYHIVRYRRKLVAKNLASSFPEKSEKELKKIARQFYRNFVDYIFETIKLMHISDAEIKRRMQFVNCELPERWNEEGRSVMVYFSHCFNWEWAPSVTLWQSQRMNDCTFETEVYRPLKSEWLDKILLKIRSRFNSVPIPKAYTLRRILEARRDGKLIYIGLMSDQKPSHGDPTFVTNFLNHPTAMITGTETLGRRLHMAALYWDMEKVKRGYYRITCVPITDDIAKEPEMSVTQRYAQLLQANIKRQPAIWLWSHNRWKRPVTLPENDQ